MKGLEQNALDLFDSMFKDGDEVVVVDDDDCVFFGRIEMTDQDTLVLKTYSSKGITIEWEDVRFISHDGFPVEKLRGADGSRLIEATNTTNIKKAIRKAATADRGLLTEPCDSCGLPVARKKLKYRRYKSKTGSCLWGDVCGRHTFVFGEPYHVWDVTAQLINPGNSGRLGYPPEREETLILTSKDGAKAFLTDLDTVFYFGQGGSP